MDKPTQRKPKQYFDTAANPSHVTFDDGSVLRRNIPWMNYVEARWEYAEPNTIKMDIGNWLIVISGHNLAPLFLAIEDHALIRICAHPEFKQDREREIDSFAVEIRFMKPLAGNLAKRGQIEFNPGA